jgi:RNA polymerase primary sigma factor/RNA polymerase sigma factor
LTFPELLSVGNEALIRAVDRFDFDRKVRFSTYASKAILNHFWRSQENEGRHRQRFVSTNGYVFDVLVVEPADSSADGVERLLTRLDPRERQVLSLRVGLGEGGGPLTLEEIARQLGITKARVRQLEQRALCKCRRLAPAC